MARENQTGQTNQKGFNLVHVGLLLKSNKPTKKNMDDIERSCQGGDIFKEMHPQEMWSTQI